MAWLTPRFLGLLTLLTAVNGVYIEMSGLRSREVKADALRDSYDYIVAGGGQSGVVIGTRLSENPDVSVLIVEYGYFEDDPAQLDPPSSTRYLTKHLFNVTSVAQPAINNRPVGAFAASIVGGGSAINGMLFDRGAAEDYDNWERLGNPGWSFEGLLPYWKKATKFTPPRADLVREFNITWDIPRAFGEGPIQATYPDWQWPGTKIQFQAWAELGLPIPIEGSAGDAYGAFWVPSVVDQSYRRSYARNAYYDPNKGRTNLELVTGQRVNEILFDSNKRATAVTIQGRGTANGSPTQTITAKQEIILCAGWMHTPQVLQRSGLGPASLLQRAGIPLLVDLPGVGGNLQDHPAWRAQFGYLSDVQPNPGTMNSNRTFQQWAHQEWATSRKGPLSMGVGNAMAQVPLPYLVADYEGFIRRYKAQNAATYLPSSYTPEQVKGYEAQREVLAASYAKKTSSVLEIPFSGSGSSSLVLEKPLSRGTVLLNTNDRYAEPILDYGVNKNPLDPEVMMWSLRYYRKWMATQAMRQLSPQEYLPGTQLSTDQQLLTSIAQGMGGTTAHSSGTAAMLPRDLAGVVSPDLLVYGVSGLSIGDISIIPLIPATHTCATVYAIAEKAADLVKSRYDPSRR